MRSQELLSHKFLVVLRDEITSKYYNALLSKLNILISKYTNPGMQFHDKKSPET